ncbi:MAG TPA: alpha/beta hydrolase family protein [Candidatus Hydrogenedentes bacterium]|nr:alpha/beta hydrolase family protein [Candidatus Hydrogenedentota bacterium]HPG65312.1 alpha/beta hydrolase family protein [Candidatus Hydrogenedentota bacterium]
MFRGAVLVLAIMSAAATVSADDGESLARRKAYLDELRRVLPACRPWEEWLERSGELPPDFATMPACAPLPDPLTRAEGGVEVPIRTPEEWQAHRRELLEQFHKWILGTVPPRPGNLEASVLADREEAGARIREVELAFGKEHKGRLHLELLMPKGPGPFPIFLTQDNHRAWALIALRRGYLACVYAGSDSRDDTDSFLDAYPKCDWSRLTRRAWAAGCCIDYLESVPEANVGQIALTGHSRNGKQSLMAAALDERISVVISSSSGQGGSHTTRYYSEQHFGEGIENITRSFPEWFHPRLRFFVGREDRLPVDFHELVALSAPRPCLLSAAYNDGAGSAWAEQTTYLAVKPVYGLFDSEDKFRILWRFGNHETWTTTIERYIDWCDLHFGRGQYAFPEQLIFPWDWASWSRESGVSIAPEAFPERGPEGLEVPGDASKWPEKRAKIIENIEFMLGEQPPFAVNNGGTYGEERPHVAKMLARDDTAGIEKATCVFGEYINADIYAPEGVIKGDRKMPLAIWLHPFSFPYGYAAAYRRGDQFYKALARNGFVVFCFDQIGCGRRIDEIEGFYDRHPKWSVLGKMVHDTRAALDVAVELPYVDPERATLVGFGLGAMVALHVAALDERPTAVAAVCGPPPFQFDTDRMRTGGIERWSHLHMLLPQLGFFTGAESRVPYDIPDLMACVAPRPLLTVTPTLDRETPLDLMKSAVETTRRVYALLGADDAFQQAVPEDYFRFGPEMQDVSDLIFETPRPFPRRQQKGGRYSVHSCVQ